MRMPAKCPVTRVPGWSFPGALGPSRRASTILGGRAFLEAADGADRVVCGFDDPPHAASAKTHSTATAVDPVMDVRLALPVKKIFASRRSGVEEREARAGQ